MSDEVWFVETLTGPFTAVRMGDVFTLGDALCHVYFGEGDMVRVGKRLSPSSPGDFDAHGMVPGIVGKVDRRFGVVTIHLET